MGYKLKIIQKLIHNHGFFQTLLLLGRMFWYKLLDLRFSRKSCETIRDAVRGKRVIVFSKAIEWNNMFQRIQQMALCFSKRENTVVIYVENPTTFDFFANLNPISDSLYCYSFRHYDRLNELLAGAKEVVLYVTNLLAYEKSMELRYDRLVYEYLDELEIFFDPENLPRAQEHHREIAGKADLCLAPASKLYTQIEPYAKRILLSPNAGDYDFFSRVGETPAAKEIAVRRGEYSMVIGYYGAIAAWFDYETIIAAAQERPDWLFVFVGVIFDETKEKYNLSAYSNILLTGAKPYRELPAYIAGMDILTIPFAVNNVTQSTSPVKLFEYMAAKRPILTAKLPECMKYASVFTYEGKEEFIAQAEKLYAMREDTEYLALLEKEARENTWEKRVAALDAALYGEEEP